MGLSQDSRHNYLIISDAKNIILNTKTLSQTN